MTDKRQLSQTRIVKRLHPGQPGCKKLGQRYGPALVCVRYRHDQQRNWRYTTVELLVDEGPLRATGLHRLVRLRLALGESELRHQACAMDAKWDEQTNTWIMSHGTAVQLGLQERAIDDQNPKRAKPRKF